MFARAVPLLTLLCPCLFLLQVRFPVVFVMTVYPCGAGGGRAVSLVAVALLGDGPQALGDGRVVGLVAVADLRDGPSAPGDGHAVVPVTGTALRDGPLAMWPERRRGMAVAS